MSETATMELPGENLSTKPYDNAKYKLLENEFKNKFNLIETVSTNLFTKNGVFEIDLKILKSFIDIIKNIDLHYSEHLIETEKEIEILEEVNPLFKEILENVLDEIEEFLQDKEIQYRIKLSLEKDLEDPNLEELVISIHSAQEDFNARSKLWDDIGNLVEEFLNELRIKDSDKKSQIDKFDETMAIEVV